MNGSTFQKIQLIFIFYGPVCINCSKNFTANVPSSLWLAIDQFDMVPAIPSTMQLKNCLWREPLTKKIMFWCSKKGNMRSNIHLLCKKVSNCAGNYKIIWANLVTLFQAKIKNDNRCKVPKQQNYNPPSLHLFTFEMGRCT